MCIVGIKLYVYNLKNIHNSKSLFIKQKQKKIKKIITKKHKKRNEAIVYSNMENTFLRNQRKSKENILVLHNIYKGNTAKPI